MKPSWDKLMDEFKDSKTAVVADVDCTVQEDLCTKHGVEGYPTIKWGAVTDLKDYDGGREYDDLLSFAKENLGPTCGPENLDLCSEEQKKEIETVSAMSDADLQKKIEEKQTEISDVEKKFNADVEELQKKYEEMEKAKVAKIAELKKSGLGMMKTVCTDRPSCKVPVPEPIAVGGEGAEGEEPAEGDEDFGDEEPPEEGDDAPEGEEGKKEDL